jgi:hypothetical protein
MAFYLGRGVAFWKPSSEGVKALNHPADPLAFFPSEPSAPLTDEPARPAGVRPRGDELTDWNEITGLAAHLTQTCERIEELAERTEGMLRRVERLAASTTSQLEHTGLLPTAVEIARVREEIATVTHPLRHRHRHHGLRGWVESRYERLRPELQARWLVARVKVGRHVSVPARHAKAELRKRFVLARVGIAVRAEQMIDWVIDTLTPLAPPAGVRVVIQPLHAPKVRVPAVVTFAGAAAFCSAVLLLLLVVISATTPALGLPWVEEPALTSRAPRPLPIDDLLSVPGAISTVLTGSAPVTPKPAPVARTVQHEPFVGTLVVESDPIGATVFVNQERVGETPLTLPQIRAGSRVIWVESDGYQRWSAGVVVPAEKLTRLNVKLTREPREPRK